MVLLDWPPYNTDLFPIEHLWDVLDRRIQLRKALVDEWNKIPMETVSALVNDIKKKDNSNSGSKRGARDFDHCSYFFTSSYGDTYQ